MVPEKYLLFFIILYVLIVNIIDKAYCINPSTTNSLLIEPNNNIKSSKTRRSIQYNDHDSENFYNTPRILKMHILSKVSNRYARTVVESSMKNYASLSKEIIFSVVLPDSAFISEFVMEIEGRNYTARVKERQEARKIYEKAVSYGFGAVYVAADTRNSNLFIISANMEPESKAIFYLTYEELLVRKKGVYELDLNIRPGQFTNLKVEVQITDFCALRNVKVLPFRSGNEIGYNRKELDLNDVIEKEHFNPNIFVVRFQPSFETQKSMADYFRNDEQNGSLIGHFIVHYDVKRDRNGGEVLMGHKFFVQYFAPSKLLPLPKHVIFVLDTSSSMVGNKMQHLKKSMMSILDELKYFDKFNLVQFGSTVKVFDREKTFVLEDEKMMNGNFEMPEHKIIRRLPRAYEVDRDNVLWAKEIINDFNPNGGTNIYDALFTALLLVEKDRKYNRVSPDEMEPIRIIIFLTDGEPSIGIYDREKIISKITDLNYGPRKSLIFTLSFGEYADEDFMRKLAIKNNGFSRHIHDDAEAFLQIKDFFKLISSPLLSEITFDYTPIIRDITRTYFPTFFNGSEIVVAAKFDSQNNEPVVVHPVIASTTTGVTYLEPNFKRPESADLELGRIWAYLTIKQLMEDSQVDHNSQFLKDKILEISIKYSFLTPLTSLVVTKPKYVYSIETTDKKVPQNWKGEYNNNSNDCLQTFSLLLGLGALFFLVMMSY